jgi:hypothetical protein
MTSYVNVIACNVVLKQFSLPSEQIGIFSPFLLAKTKREQENLAKNPLLKEDPLMCDGYFA